MTDITDTQLKTLRAIHAEGDRLRAKPKTPVFVQLAKKGMVEYNPKDVDGEGKHPYRLTPTGHAAMTAMTEPTESDTMTDQPSFALASVELPTISRAATTSRYPFDQLAVDGPNSFFIPTGDRKNPSKSFGSLVSSRNKTAGFKKFTLRTIDDGAPWGHAGVKGVAVFILADEAPAEDDDNE